MNVSFRKPDEEDTLFGLLSKKIAVMPSKGDDKGGLLPLLPLSQIENLKVLHKRILSGYDGEYDGVEFICGPLNDYTYFVDFDLHLDIKENSDKLNTALIYLTEDRIKDWKELPYYRVGSKGLAFPIKVSDNSKTIRSLKTDWIEIKTSGFCAIPPGIHRMSGRAYKSLGKTKSLIDHLKIKKDVLIIDSDRLISFVKQFSKKEDYVEHKYLSPNTGEIKKGRNNYVFSSLVSFKKSLRKEAKYEDIKEYIENILSTIDFEIDEADEFSFEHWYTQYKSIRINQDIDEEIMGQLIPLKRKEKDFLEETSKNLVVEGQRRLKRFSPLMQAYSEKDNKLMHAFPDGLNFKSDLEAIDCFEVLITNITGSKPRVWNGRIHIWNGCYWEMLTMSRLERAFNSLLPAWDTSKSLRKMKEPTSFLVRKISDATNMHQEKEYSLTTGGLQYIACKKEKKLKVQAPTPEIFTRFKMDYKLEYLGEVSFEEYLEKFKTDCPMLYEFINYSWNTPEVQKMNDFENILKCFQEVVAAVLFCMGPRFQRMILFTGIAKSGKSTIMNIISGLLPRGFVSTTSPVDWQTDYGLGNMLDKMINIVTDLECNTAIPDAIFKKVVAGEPVRINIKFQQPIDHAEITCTQLVASNSPPKTYDNTDGFRRRWLCFYHAKRIENTDRDFATKIIQNEGTGLFNFALGGVNRLLQNEDYTPTFMNQKMIQSMSEKNDVVFVFLKNIIMGAIPTLRLNPDKKISVNNLCASFNRERLRAGSKAINTSTFDSQIADKLISSQGFFPGLTYDELENFVIGIEEVNDFKIGI